MTGICKHCNRELEIVSDNMCTECLDYYIDYCENAWNGAEDNYQKVTKEMAIDAGDRRLEGQRINW